MKDEKYDPICYKVTIVCLIKESLVGGRGARLDSHLRKTIKRRLMLAALSISYLMMAEDHHQKLTQNHKRASDALLAPYRTAGK